VFVPLVERGIFSSAFAKFSKAQFKVSIKIAELEHFGGSGEFEGFYEMLGVPHNWSFS